GCLQAPGERITETWFVAAEQACAHRGGQILPKTWAFLADRLERRRDRPTGILARPLGRVGGTPHPAIQTDGARKLGAQEIDLPAGTLGSPRIIEVFGLLQLVAQILEPTPVGGACGGVQELPSITGLGDVQPTCRTDPLISSRDISTNEVEH